MSTVSSQEFNRNPTSVKRKADRGPVYITEHGEPAYVVISVADYRRLQGITNNTLVDLLSSGDPLDDYELPSVAFDIARAAL